MIRNPDVKPRKYWLLREIWGIVGYVLGEGCGHNCEHAAPFGFVPEACCPIHDSERRWHMPLLKVLVRIFDDH